MSSDEHTELVFRNGIGEPVPVLEEQIVDAHRPYRSWKRRQGGDSWVKIALEEGYRSPEAARTDVKLWMDSAKAVVVEASQADMLALEVSRLDSLQQALWRRALAGDIPAIQVARTIIMDRAKLLGLETAIVSAQANSASTVIMGGTGDDEESYVASITRDVL